MENAKRGVGFGRGVLEAEKQDFWGKNGGKDRLDGFLLSMFFG